jgi:hypothetical protein
LDITTKAETTKKSERVDCTELKSFFTAKKTIDRMKKAVSRMG